MSISYLEFNEMPDNKILDGMIKLHSSIFGESDELAERMKKKSGLRIDLAIDGDKIVGYKIGYALNDDKFYSWLGGVDAEYRKQGIGNTLMEKQHRFLKECGYKV